MSADPFADIHMNEPDEVETENNECVIEQGSDMEGQMASSGEEEDVDIDV